MSRLSLLFLSTFLWLAVAQLGAADQADYPPLPEGLSGTPQAAELIVYLPSQQRAALAGIHAWNAGVAAAGGSPSEYIPTLAELYGNAAPGDHEAWRLSDGPTLFAGDLVVGSAAAYDLRSDPAYPGVLLVVVPADLRQRIQAVIDAHQAMGAVAPPRPAITSDHGVSLADGLGKIAASSGLAQLGPLNYVMLGVAVLLLWLAIAKGFEPLLLVPIATGCIFVNAVGANMVAEPTAVDPGGMLYYFFTYGIETGIFPLLIFLGVGSLTDFGPLLANPWSALLGAAAQFGIFGSFFLAAVVGELTGVFSLADCAAIAIIGGADGPTSIYVASKLAPDLLGAIAVAAYSYMALVPIIQPPVMRALTTQAEREIMMKQARPVSRRAKILFPLVVVGMCILLLPDAVPLIGMLMFGNLLRESGVTDRLAKCAQNELINLVTIALGLSVGTKMSADMFLKAETLLILGLGCVAFVIGTGMGVVFGKVMCKVTGGKVNPLIGAAGVSAVPMAARVVQGEGQRYNKRNFLLMHAMGPNVAGVVGSAVAAGILISLLS